MSIRMDWLESDVVQIPHPRIPALEGMQKPSNQEVVPGHSQVEGKEHFSALVAHFSTWSGPQVKALH